MEHAREILLNDWLTFGIVMVKAGDADGMVAGACHSTADTLSPALQILKTAPGVKLVSAFFVMDTQFKDQGDDGTFIFADCGLNQDPNAEELAAIAEVCCKHNLYVIFVVCVKRNSVCCFGKFYLSRIGKLNFYVKLFLAGQ